MTLANGVMVTYVTALTRVTANTTKHTGSKVINRSSREVIQGSFRGHPEVIGAVDSRIISEGDIGRW